MRIIAIWIAVWASALAPVPARAEDRTPPSEIVYRVQVLDQATGQPVAGVTLEIRQRKVAWRCYGDGCGELCETTDSFATDWVTTGVNGTGEVVFPMVWCEIISVEPMTWLKELHDGFDAPAVVDCPSEGVGSDYLCARWVPGDGLFDQVVWVTPKSALATAFAPVLHRHDGYELQEGLADLEETVDGHAVLEAFNVQGQRLFGPAPMPPIHVWDDWHWDSFGRGQTAAYWRLDIDDPWRHRGTEPGSRPLYYHVLPYADGAVVQYWLWLNANDLASQWGFGGHEGDWEYAALRVRFQDGAWAPVTVNLSRHKGGAALAPADCWWSQDGTPDYAGIQPGWSQGKNHPHFWVASNSHALYNRYEETYTLDLNGLGSCGGSFCDAVDYNLADQPRGAHSFFTYDRLEPMGDFWHTSHAHGYTWFDHLEGGPLEPLRFYGRFGKGNCDAPSGCADALCGIIASFDGGTYQLAPVSPLLPEEPHQWSGFVDALGRWGNPNSRVSFRANVPRRCYLGLFLTLPGGGAEAITFATPAAHPERSGVARVELVSGDVHFLDADATGEIGLGPAVNGAYRFSQSRIEGSGRVAIDIFPQGMSGELDAEDLFADLLPSDGTSGAESPGRALDASEQILASPNPASGRVRIQFSADAPAARRIRISDVAGREIWVQTVGANDRETSWDGRASDGTAAPSGIYFVYEEIPGRPPQRGRLLVLR